METKEIIKLVEEYVILHISEFHSCRINKLKTLKLKTILKKKNPYLFKAKYFTTAADIVKSLSDAFISSAEETIFGDWLEGLAIYVCEKVYNGRKSTTTGIDLEFDKEGIRYVVAIKSGPNWGNSSQITKMRSDFLKATRTLRTSKSNLDIRCINGCCYGIANNPNKGDYYKYCGQEFWHFISGEKTLYTNIIEPLATNAKERNEEFQVSYGNMLNKFTKEFINGFCLADGSIDWKKLVKYNSECKAFNNEQ